MLVSIFVLSILVIDVAYSYKSSPKYTPSSRSKLSLDAGKKAIPVEASKLVLDAHSAKQIEGLHEGMRMRNLPNTNTKVSEICLGTMMWGDQVSESDAIAQLDMATKRYGINFIDTAESYPNPSSPSTSGESERIIGRWLTKNNRKDIIISTKICGFSNEMTWMRKNSESSGFQGTELSSKQIEEAVDGQLKRLQTDYIDLIQFHWPQRYVPLYGSMYNATNAKAQRESEETSILAQLTAINKLIKSGKVRHFGLSNETPYGLNEFHSLAKANGLAMPVTIQNAYNLLERNDFDTGLLESCLPHNLNVGLLAHSPMAGGILSGKYGNNVKTAHRNTRFRKYPGFMHRYTCPSAMKAVAEYQHVADELSLPFGPMALAFVYSRPFVTSTIVGVTDLKQLEDSVMALNIAASFDEAITNPLDDVFCRNIDPTKGRHYVVDPNKDYTDPSKLPWGAKDQDVDPELDALITQRVGY